MSTSYRPLEKISALELFDGRLEAFGIRERVTADSNEERRCLTDGRNCVWVEINEEGRVTHLVRYFPGGAPRKILDAVAQAFDTDIFSEYQPQYWGFDTQEEWDAFQDKIAKEHADQFYADVLKFLRGEPHHIGPGTNGMTMAKIAKALVEKDASLLDPRKEGRVAPESSRDFP
jgi:hypothetical protein